MLIFVNISVYFFKQGIASSVAQYTVINEGPANEVLVVFKAPI